MAVLALTLMACHRAQGPPRPPATPLGAHLSFPVRVFGTRHCRAQALPTPIRHLA